MQGFTLAQLAARQGGIALPTYRHRFRRELQQFVARPGSQVIPRGPLVLLVDGLWFQFKRHPWVLYLMALKPCQGDYAVFLDPVLLAGTERVARWDQALASIPQAASERIRAIVADNLPGMRRLAHQRGWVLQLCHFHLLLKLYAQRGSRPHALYGGPVREQLHQCIRHALSLSEGAPLDTTLRRLHRLALTDCAPPASKAWSERSCAIWSSTVPISSTPSWAFLTPPTRSSPWVASCETCSGGAAPVRTQPPSYGGLPRSFGYGLTSPATAIYDNALSTKFLYPSP
ncbi:MAG: hypothetical protein JSW71_19120, partial [Gemmatimonadota bacterium]